MTPPDRPPLPEGALEIDLPMAASLLMEALRRKGWQFSLTVDAAKAAARQTIRQHVEAHLAADDSRLLAGVRRGELWADKSVLGGRLPPGIPVNCRD